MHRGDGVNVLLEEVHLYLVPGHRTSVTNHSTQRPRFGNPLWLFAHLLGKVLTVCWMVR